MTANHRNIDFENIANTPIPSLLFDEKAETEIRLFINNRFDHLDEDQRRAALQNYGAQNICDYGDLQEIGTKRLFTADEKTEFTWCANYEAYSGNAAAVECTRQVEKKQRAFRAASSLGAKRTKPKNAREFENTLRDVGFSKNEARRITAHGFAAAV